MASKSFLNCLSGKKHPVPQSLIEAAEAADKGGKREQAILVNKAKEHVASLKNQKIDLHKQQSENIKIEKKRMIEEGSVPGSYTNRSEDPNNELNSFQTLVGKLRKNLVQRTGSVVNALKSDLLKENGIEAKERAVIDDFNSGFKQDIVESLDKLFKTKDNKYFRFEDMVQYLPELGNDKLDTPTKETIAATAYEWMHTNGRTALGQTNATMRALLQLEKDAPIPAGVAELIRDVGVNSEALAKQLGATILKRMSIAPTGESDYVAKERLELSLGFMAIAAMEQSGKLSRQEIYTGFDSNGQRGMAALRAGIAPDISDVFHDPTQDKDESTIKFMKLDNEGSFSDFVGPRGQKYPSTPAHMEDGEKLLRAAPDAFDKLFDSESEDWNFSWNKMKLPKNVKIGRDSVASPEQVENLQKSIDVPYDANREVMDIFDMLDNDALGRVIGVVDDSLKLEIREKSIEGTNRGLQRDLDKVRAWQEAAAEREDSTFYIFAKFMNNMRMLQTGDINTQNSKMMRNLFSPKAWKATFDPTVKKQVNKTGIERAFQESVAVAFGIESGKVGGSDIQVKMLNELLEDPESNIRPALEAIKSHLRNGDPLTPEQQNRVAAGVEETGEDVHGFKGLVEYARYEVARRAGREFTTSMYTEIDGVSNGPVIGILQLIPDSADKQAVLAALAMGGMSINPNAKDGQVNLDKLLAKHGLHDAYQRMGHEWAKEIAMMLKDLDAKRKTGKTKDMVNAELNFQRMTAINELLDDFVDEDGLVQSTLRKLSKPRTMQTTYAASIRTQNELLAEGDIIGAIYKLVEKVITEVDEHGSTETAEAEFKRILKWTRVLVGDQKSAGIPIDDINISMFMENGELTVRKLKKFKIEPNNINDVVQATRQTYGEAMDKAINTVYAGLIEARKPFSPMMQRPATIYNLVLKKKVDAAIAENDAKLDEAGEGKLADMSKRGRITKDQLNDILKSIEHLIPVIKSPFKDGKLALAEPGRGKDGAKDYDNEALQVKQSYNTDAGVVRNRGIVEGIPYLKTIGASAMVRMTQMLDSSVANDLMGLPGVDILNAHDGFPHGISDSTAVRDRTNHRFFEVMRDYSMGDEIVQMHKGVSQAMTDAVRENRISPDELIEAFLDDGIISRDNIGALINMNSEAIREGIGATQKEENLSYADATKAFYKKHINQYPNGKLEFLKDFNASVTERAIDMGDQVTTNKKEFTDRVTVSAQYPHNGVGVDIDPVVESDSIFEGEDAVPIDNVLVADERRSERTADDIAKLVREGFHPSGSSEVSTNENDYPNPVHIDKQNVTEVMQSIVDLDNQAPYAAVNDSAAHVAHMTRILNDVVAKVMKPVDLFKAQHNINTRETGGIWQETTDGRNRIWIQTQDLSNQPKPGMLTQGLRMSGAEVYTHEMIHHIVVGGLKNKSLRATQLRKQAHALYELAHDKFVEQYGDEAYRVFLTNPDDLSNADERLAAQERWDYVFGLKRTEGTLNHNVNEFLAHGLANENFRRSLDGLVIDANIIDGKKEVKKIWGGNIQETLVNLFTRIMDFISQRFFDQQHSTKIDQELENLVKAISELESNTKNVLFEAADNAEKTATAMSVNLDEKIKKTVSKAMTKTALGRIISKQYKDSTGAIKKLPEFDNMISHRMRVLLNWYNNSEQGLIASIVTEMKGSTERLKPLQALLSRRNRVIDAAKGEAAANIRATVLDWFQRDLEPHEKKAITKVLLKTDIGALDGQSSLQAIQGFLEDSSQLEGRIDALVGEIKKDPDLVQYATFFENAADDLGYYMVTSDAREDGVPLMNAYNIAQMKLMPTEGALTGEAFDRAVKLIDQLTTLSSIRYVDSLERRTVSELMKEDPNAIENVLIHHNKLKEEALETSFYGNPTLMQKGYTKQILNARIKYEQGTLADRERMEEAGFHMQKTPIERDPRDPVKDDIYMFKNVLGTVNDLQSGIASSTRNTAKGQVSYDIQKQIGNKRTTVAQAEANNDHMLRVVTSRLDKMTKVRSIPPKRTAANYMVPQYDVNGDITQMRYVMSESTKDSVLQQHSDFEAVLAAMTSQIIDKRETPKINADLIYALKDLYDKEFKDYPEAYVEISPYSTNPRYREIYNMLPPKAKETVQSVWGSHRMMVSQDVIDLAFGQRKATIVDMFAKDKHTRTMVEKMVVEVLNFALGWNNPFVDPPPDYQGTESKQGRAVRRAKFFEDTASQLTKIAKSNIVVRNLPVISGNHMSNTAYLKSKGIPLSTIMKDSREAFESALRYQKDNDELNKLVTQRGVIDRKHSLSRKDRDIKLRAIDRRVAYLQNEITQNPSTDMIAAGLMPNIVDDVDTANVESPHTFGIERVLETGLGKLPDRIEGAARTLFMTEDTESYRMMNNAVKMTDYVGRYVLYNHYTKNKDMSHDDAVAAVQDEFINFDLPTHKILEYANNVGLLWFSKYQLRVLKHIKNVVLENPFTSIATFLLGQFAGGNNILNSVPGLTKDLGQVMGDPITALDSVTDTLYIDGVIRATN
jgi:hypothetical protein